MSYRNSGLVDFTLDLDTSALEARLDEIEGKLESSTVDDENIARAVEQALNDSDFIDRGTAEDIFREMAHSEGEDLIRDTISNEGYITESDVDNKLGDYVTDDDLDSRIRDVISDEGLNSDAVADAEEVETLKADLADLTRRFESYANKTDSIRGLDERVTTLERDLATLNEASGKAISLFELLRRAVEILVSR